MAKEKATKAKVAKAAPKTGAPKHVCPFCDKDMGVEDMPFCQLCGVEVFYCPNCHRGVARDTKKCPGCGTPIIIK